MDPVLLTCILVLNSGGLLFGALLLLRAPRRRPLLDLTGFALLATALFTLGFGLGELVLWDHFAVVRLWCNALFCVLAPLAIARGLQRRDGPGWSLLALGLAAEGAYVYAHRIEPYRLQITRHAIESERLAEGAPSLRVAVLADLQTDTIGAYERRVFERLDEERADLVLIPGDLLQLSARGSSPGCGARERAALTGLFAGLQHRPRLGFLMVGGDCEPRGVGLEEAGVRLLEDEALVFADERLQVIGLTCSSSRRLLEDRLATAARDFPGLTIAMGHAPEFALYSAEQRIGVPLLCVAGHTHGGQVVLPFFGPLVTLSRVPRPIAAGGLFRLGESWLCVSRGIGMERGSAPRIRFLCPPELVVLELRPAGNAVQ